MADKLVLVLGMHRSGTSAITRGLKVLGVDLGNSFIPNYDDNVKGFWEDADFQALNVEMLQFLGEDWHTLNICTDSDLPEKLASFHLPARDLLKQKLSAVSLLGIKDPRFSRLLPFWQPLFDTEKVRPLYVIPLRNPISVALSLQKRNGFDFEKSFYLWQQHMLLSVLGAKENLAVVVDFDRILKQPDHELIRVSQCLGLDAPGQELLQEYCADYLDKNLRHTQYTLADLEQESAVPASVLETFRILSQVAQDELALHDKEFKEFFAQQWQDLQQFNPLFQFIDRRERTLEEGIKREHEFEQTLEKRTNDIHQQSKALQQLRETIERQKGDLVAGGEAHQRSIAEHQKVLEDHRARLVDQDEKYKTRLQDQEESHQRILEEHRAQLVDQDEKYKARLQNQEVNHRRILKEHKTRLVEQDEKHKARLQDQEVNHKQTIAGYKERLAGQIEEYKSKLSRYQQRLADAEESHKNTVDGQKETQFWLEKQAVDRSRLLDSRQREVDGLRRNLTEKERALQEQGNKAREHEAQLVKVSEQLKSLQNRYDKLKRSPAWQVASNLSLIAQGRKYLVNFPKMQGRGKGDVAPKLLKRVHDSGLFDEAWYLQGLAAEQQPEEPLQHYLVAGWKQGINPSVLFDGNWYLKKYPDVKSANVCPLYHYLEWGWAEGRHPSPAFDNVWYLQFYGDVRSAKQPPLQHYKLFGGKEGRKPNPLFDVDWYTKIHRLKASDGKQVNALEHYLLASRQQDAKDLGVCEPHPLFCTQDYIAQHPDFNAAESSALEHFYPRVQPYLQAVAEQSVIDEGISRSFDNKAAAEVCQRIRRIEFTEQSWIDDALVSIIMPTHNRRDKIFAAIDSVFKQSYENWELLIVDDGSEDGTYEAILDKYQDSRLNVQYTEAQGVCHARNVALSLAKGELIAYLDSDNTWVNDFLELMVAYLKQENADFVYAAIRMQNEGGTNYRYREFNHDDLLIKNFIDLNAILHKRYLYDQLGGFDENLSRMVDWDLIIRYTDSVAVESVPFIGVNYDNHKQPDRITVKEPKSWRYAIMNKHLLDWNELLADVEQRDDSLVSIIIPVYGQLELTRKCVFSLLNVPAGRQFEIILVDNGSGHEVLTELFMWAEGRSEIRLVRNSENLNFALGCNIGFAHAKGRKVVFLNNDTEVTDGWLEALLKPLAQSTDIGAVQPKLLYPDGRIQCAGITFSERSPIGFPIYTDFPANAHPLQQSRRYQAVTAACMAVDSKDFAQLHGFDPLYVNGQEDVDLCLRLATLNKSCWYEATSVVVHHESRTPGRGQFIAQNRDLFAARWADKIQPDAEKYFVSDGFKVRGWRTDNQTVAAYQPILGRIRQPVDGTSRQLSFAIKVPCPHVGIKQEWGDYHFARSLGAALRRAGHNFRIDFLDSWEKGEDQPDEINLVLRGLSVFEPRPHQTNLMWMISHPDKVSHKELEQYDHVFVASEIYTEQLRKDLGDKVSCLLQCTDPALFYPGEKDPKLASEVLFVGNSRNQFREVVRMAVEANLPLSVYGTRWEQFLAKSYIKGKNIPNHQLGAYYRSAGVVLNDHWPDMREKGFVSNRIFDVLACGVPLVSDRIEGIPDELVKFVSFYCDEPSLQEVVEFVQKEIVLDRQKRLGLATMIHQSHNFDRRARVLISTLSGGSCGTV